MANTLTNNEARRWASSKHDFSTASPNHINADQLTASRRSPYPPTPSHPANPRPRRLLAVVDKVIQKRTSSQPSLLSTTESPASRRHVTYGRKRLTASAMQAIQTVRREALKMFISNDSRPAVANNASPLVNATRPPAPRRVPSLPLSPPSTPPRPLPSSNQNISRRARAPELRSRTRTKHISLPVPVWNPSSPSRPIPIPRRPQKLSTASQPADADVAGNPVPGGLFGQPVAGYGPGHPNIPHPQGDPDDENNGGGAAGNGGPPAGAGGGGDGGDGGGGGDDDDDDDDDDDYDDNDDGDGGEDDDGESGDEGEEDEDSDEEGEEEDEEGPDEEDDAFEQDEEQEESETSEDSDEAQYDEQQENHEYDDEEDDEEEPEEFREPLHDYHQQDFQPSGLYDEVVMPSPHEDLHIDIPPVILQAYDDPLADVALTYPPQGPLTNDPTFLHHFFDRIRQERVCLNRFAEQVHQAMFDALGILETADARLDSLRPARQAFLAEIERMSGSETLAGILVGARKDAQKQGSTVDEDFVEWNGEFNKRVGPGYEERAPSPPAPATPPTLPSFMIPVPDDSPDSPQEAGSPGPSSPSMPGPGRGNGGGGGFSGFKRGRDDGDDDDNGDNDGPPRDGERLRHSSSHQAQQPPHKRARPTYLHPSAAASASTSAPVIPAHQHRPPTPVQPRARSGRPLARENAVEIDATGMDVALYRRLLRNSNVSTEFAGAYARSPGRNYWEQPRPQQQPQPSASESHITAERYAEMLQYYTGPTPEAYRGLLPSRRSPGASGSGSRSVSRDSGFESVHQQDVAGTHTAYMGGLQYPEPEEQEQEQEQEQEEQEVDPQHSPAADAHHSLHLVSRMTTTLDTPSRSIPVERRVFQRRAFQSSPTRPRPQHPQTYSVQDGRSSSEEREMEEVEKSIG